jgi:hypothetical protein
LAESAGTGIGSRRSAFSVRRSAFDVRLSPLTSHFLLLTSPSSPFLSPWPPCETRSVVGEASPALHLFKGGQTGTVCLHLEAPASSASLTARPVHPGAPGLFFVSKASRFTLFISKASGFAFSVNESPRFGSSSINAMRQARLTAGKAGRFTYSAGKCGMLIYGKVGTSRLQRAFR